MSLIDLQPIRDIWWFETDSLSSLNFFVVSVSSRSFAIWFDFAFHSWHCDVRCSTFCSCRSFQLLKPRQQSILFPSIPFCPRLWFFVCVLSLHFVSFLRNRLMFGAKKCINFKRYNMFAFMYVFSYPNWLSFWCRKKRTVSLNNRT